MIINGLFCQKNGGNVMLTAKFARHTNLQITMTYIHAKKEELYESIERANDEILLTKVRNMQGPLTEEGGK